MSASQTSRPNNRKPTVAVRIGRITIGAGNPVAVQSMTNTPTTDAKATLGQIRRLEKVGCEIVRIAVPDSAAADALPIIRQGTAMPLVADIHFDYRLALAALKAGFDKIRINPGNIGATWKVKEVIRAAADCGAAIRIGVNSGSIARPLIKKFGGPTPEAMLASLAGSLEPFEQLGFSSIVLSAKTTTGQDAIEVSRLISRSWRYPQHLGLTESGLPFEGAIRSAAVLGVLLAEGIGDTIRISLSGNPVAEVTAAWELLAALGIRQRGPLVFACPTCARAGIDVARLAAEVKRALRHETRPLRVAVMGCVVNGPGEARSADFGIAGGKGKGVIFAAGRVIRTCSQERLVSELIGLIRRV